MQQSGSLLIRVFTSRAQLPVEGATAVVAVPAVDGRQTVLAIMRTNESGLTGSVTLEAPDAALSLDPGNLAPFASYNLVVEHPDYYLALFDGLQVFSGVETVQEVPLTPLPQPVGPRPDSARKVTITPQTL